MSHQTVVTAQEACAAARLVPILTNEWPDCCPRAQRFRIPWAGAITSSLERVKELLRLSPMAALARAEGSLELIGC